MPRSSFSDNPLLRVSRPVSACSRSGRENECSSANDQFARGKERSYVAALELRVEKLEKRLAFARSRKASVSLHDVDEAAAAPADRKDSLANIRAAIHRKAARKREDSDVNSLVSDFGFLYATLPTYRLISADICQIRKRNDP
ncbi:zn(II)2Cys6 cluster transcriptional activator [Colletotrichum tofieldiae]|nr:zn(II)2Cys6 cluster transcriptional activator [Colletotrichum tofieldiae]